MADEMLLKTQQWLNRTYGQRAGFGSVDETGTTGWDTVYGLIRALQIELGITATANNFGPGTQSRFKAKYPNGITDLVIEQHPRSNIYAIIQGALWCKGYPAVYGGITQEFSDEVKDSILDLKRDMGFEADSTVDLDIMMCLLSMKQFKLLEDYGGKVSIRSLQQYINRNHRAYTGIVPTDGLYGREMNTALIQVLQKLEGFSPDEATGYFGNGTRSRLQTVGYGGSNDWVWLVRAALICNGSDLLMGSVWTSHVTDAVKEFQQRHALPITGAADRTTWMSLLTSKGDPDRACIACDTRFEITDEFAKRLKSDGYQIVGRYLTEPNQENLSESNYFKALRTGELERIVSHGLKYFPIFQEYSTRLSNFTEAEGVRHANEAQAAARRLGVPPTVIYFAVDYDATDPEISSNIIPYFRGVAKTLRYGYIPGIYASRNVCTRVINTGFAFSAFVSDMSTGFSGNLGFTIPRMWNYDQFTEISGYAGKWDLDRVAYSGRYPACDRVDHNQQTDPDTNKYEELVAEKNNAIESTIRNIVEPLGLLSDILEIGFANSEKKYIRTVTTPDCIINIYYEAGEGISTSGKDAVLSIERDASGELTVETKNKIMDISTAINFDKLADPYDATSSILNSVVTIKAGNMSFSQKFISPYLSSFKVTYNVDDILPNNEALDYSYHVGITFDIVKTKNDDGNVQYSFQPQVNPEVLKGVALVAIVVLGIAFSGGVIPDISPTLIGAGVLMAN